MANTDTSFLPAYLIVGEDVLKREAVIARLKARFEQMGDLSFNFDTFKGEAALGSDIVNACNTLPFMSDQRLVLVENVESLSKNDSEEIISYLSSPSDTAVLALVAEKLAKNTRLYKAVAALGKQAIIECAPLAQRDLPAFVRQLAVNHGAVLTDRSALALIELVGTDTMALDVNVKKLAVAHLGKDPITPDEVRALVADEGTVKPWLFLDAFCERDLTKCLEMLPRIEGSSAYSLLAMCVGRIRELICAQSLGGSARSADLAAALEKRDWQVKNHVRWAKGFSVSELSAAVLSARDCEQAMKSGTDPDAAFLEWLLATVPKRRAPK